MLEPVLMQWYVVQTKPHQERQTEFHLRQLSVEIFLPLLELQKKRRGEDKMVVEPLFPRYLFARFDLTKHYRAVKYAKGVQRIVEFCDKPAVVDESLVNGIKAKLEDRSFTLKTRSIEKGQVVRISSGPLHGLEMIFLREMSDQRRALLLLRVLGLQAKVILNMEQVSFSRAM